MLGENNKVGWNARMMIWVGLIIIVFWSMNRWIGRNDCISSNIISEVQVVGDALVDEISICHGQSAYDFTVDKYASIIDETNQRLEKFQLSIEPVKVILDNKKIYTYEVSDKEIRLGRENFSPYLVRALLEVKYGESLPKDHSRAFYLDFLEEAHGGRSAMPGSIHIVHYLVGIEGYCNLNPTVPEDIESCRLNNLPSQEQYRATLLLRPVVLGIWRLFFSALNEDDRGKFLKHALSSGPRQSLPEMDFSSQSTLARSFSISLNKMAESMLDAELLKKFVDFSQTALRTQVRGDRLSVDYVLESADSVKLPINALLEKHGNRITPSILIGLDFRSPVIQAKTKLDRYDLTVRYWFRCITEGQQIRIPAKYARRLNLLLNCDDKVSWDSLWTGELQNFLERNPQLGLVQLYLPSLSESKGGILGRLRMVSGAASESSIFGKPIGSLQPSPGGFQISGDSDFIEFYRPVKGREKLVFTQGEGRND